MVQVLHDDSPYETARKIFEEFELHQSCTITGTLIDEEKRTAFFKGELVLKELKIMDECQNTNRPAGDKRLRRKRVILEDSIGGYVAQKIFRFKKTVLDGETRWSIWRFQ